MTSNKHDQTHPVYGPMRITSLALPTAWRPYLARVNKSSLAAGVRRAIIDHAQIADMLRRDVPADELKRAMVEMFAFIHEPARKQSTPVDRYHVHAPTKAGKPRRLHPAQVVTTPTVDALRPRTATYTAAALDSIRATMATDQHATESRHDLPNRAQEAGAVHALLAEALHQLGAQVGPLQRTRGTRQPYAVITWPVGWTVPEQEDDERSK